MTHKCIYSHFWLQFKGCGSPDAIGCAQGIEKFPTFVGAAVTTSTRLKTGAGRDGGEADPARALPEFPAQLVGFLITCQEGWTWQPGGAVLWRVRASRPRMCSPET